LSSPGVDTALVARTAIRLFAFRKQHSWPPKATVNANWNSLYKAAAEGMNVLPDASEAVNWLNSYIATLDDQQNTFRIQGQPLSDGAGLGT